MGAEKENRQFKWISGNSGNGPVFPIDYSQRSYAEYLGTDPRQVKRYVIDHPFFRDILRGQFYQNQRDGKFPKRSNNAIISIPAESALFFQCFYELAVDKKYHAAFCSGKDHVSEQILAQFLRDLCQKISLRIEGDDKEENPYYRHVLYENEVFRQKLLPDLWAQELEPRIEKLKELSKNARTENQLEALMDCILCLDRNIINLMPASQDREIGAKSNNKNLCASNNVAFSPSKIGIQNLLEDLLQREQAEPDDPTFPFAVYQIDDIVLAEEDDLGHAHSLEGAFYELSHHTTKPQTELEKFARKMYLKHLGAKRHESDFEMKYLLAMKYLRVWTGIEEHLLEDLVKDRVKTYCNAHLDQCFALPNQTLPPIKEKYTDLHYIAQLVDNLVNSAISPVFYQYSEIISFTSCLVKAGYGIEHDRLRILLLKCQIEQAPSIGLDAECHPAVVPEWNLTLLETRKIAAYFSLMWQELYGEAVLDPESGRVLDPDQTAHRISEEGLANEAFFGREKIFQLAPEDICAMFRIYEEIISAPDRLYGFESLLKFAPPLLYFLLLAIYRRKADRTIPMTISYVRLLLQNNK